MDKKERITQINSKIINSLLLGLNSNVDIPNAKKTYLFVCL